MREKPSLFLQPDYDKKEIIGRIKENYIYIYICRSCYYFKYVTNPQEGGSSIVQDIFFFEKIYLKKRMNFAPTAVLRQNRTTKETDSFLFITHRKKERNF